MNTGRPAWTLLFVVVVITTTGLVVGLSGVNGDTYARPTVTGPLYGAGLGANPAAAPAEQQPEWAKRMEGKIDQLLKYEPVFQQLLDELSGDKPPATGSADDGPYFRELSKDDAAAVRRKVSRTGAGQMPPKDAPQLAAEEKAALLAAFDGQPHDKNQLAAAGVKCVTCHSSATKEPGGGFVMFELKKKP